MAQGCYIAISMGVGERKWTDCKKDGKSRQTIRWQILFVSISHPTCSCDYLHYWTRRRLSREMALVFIAAPSLWIVPPISTARTMLKRHSLSLVRSMCRNERRFSTNLKKGSSSFVCSKGVRVLAGRREHDNTYINHGVSSNKPSIDKLK